ncbi:MAG TPA: TraB/GumN family protein [Rhizomicrobium sp.]|nr:TraB/GumN family protein [Rhizomicrobium sp.]
MLILLSLFRVAPALADEQGPASETAAPLTAAPEPVEAHPPFFTVHGKHGTVYLLGSIHALPDSIRWRTPEIAAAIEKADVFGFEIAMDESAMAGVRTTIMARGMLPEGKTLHAMLSPEGQENLDKAIAATGIQPQIIDRMQPWLAALTLVVTRMMKQSNATPTAGIDMVLANEAEQRHKEQRYMETLDDQLKLIMPAGDDPGVKEFEAMLKNFQKADFSLEKLFSAWGSGDATKIEGMFNNQLKGHNKERRALLDDRNKAWVKKIEAMLDTEDKVFLITVGAGHLVGKDGVPNLLRRAGYKVDGPP